MLSEFVSFRARISSQAPREITQCSNKNAKAKYVESVAVTSEAMETLAVIQKVRGFCKFLPPRMLILGVWSERAKMLQRKSKYNYTRNDVTAASEAFCTRPKKQS